MSTHDREQLEGWAQALREELARIVPAPWNVIKIRDRREELARIEARLARESDLHARFLDYRAELVTRFYTYRDERR